jgi:predicted metal-dependent hydrolase
MRILPRKPKFAIERTPLHWVEGDAQTTHTVNVLSLLLPSGERWFCRVFRRALPLVTDPELREDVDGFVGQEASHAVAHQRVIDLFQDQGLDVQAYLDRVDWLFDRVLGDKPFGLELPAKYQRTWLVARVALIAGIEHYTTFLGNWVLRADALERASLDRAMLDLLLWHGAEEVEHRSVAFDLFEHIGGSYVERVAAIVLASAALHYFWFEGVRYLMHNDPESPGPSSFAAFVAAGRRGTLPRYGDITRSALRYLSPWHHPSREPAPAAMRRVLDAYPARQPVLVS